ncbi:hypothetical protein U737_20860 [Methylomonas sp. LW13]|nr:hypothetical protein CWO84_17845 [Methylomonas sp. Kb3]QBC30015.1 hypothetical protein U737_20860 [Methylomonas sp. LW13]
MTHSRTPSEKFVTQICAQSFLKLWTHPNPKGKKGKELCDCLIVCGPHIIIISVKENEYRNTGDKVGWERWTKAAIDKSASQIWGAERWLETVDEVLRHDGRVVALPHKSKRKYHRVSVSLGGRGEVPLKWGDFGNGFIHICDEYSVGIIFDILDTVTDFVDFLTASEELVSRGTKPLFMGGGIEDLLALYLSHGRSFNVTGDCGSLPDMLILHDDLWSGFSKSNDFKRIKNDLASSYGWDSLIEFYANDILTDGMFDMHSKAVTSNELALVAMALQPRGHRANLTEALIEFLEESERKIASRVVLGFDRTAFVFLAGSSSDRELRVRELALRCLVVRGRLPDVITVVGIATDRPETSEVGYSSDLGYIFMPEWSEQNEVDVIKIQSDLGYFKNAQWSKGSS